MLEWHSNVKAKATNKLIDNDGSHMFIESELELIHR